MRMEGWLKREVESAARDVARWPAWMRGNLKISAIRRQKRGNRTHVAVRLIPVSKVVKMLIEEGYRAAKSHVAGAEGIETLRQNFKAALMLANKLGTHRNTVDFILRDYAARSKRTSWIIHTIELPSPNMILEFARLGASRPAVELVAEEFARQGSTYAFLNATKLLGRKPKETEVRLLVENYVRRATGGSQISETENELIRIAGLVSEALTDEVSEKLASRRRRLMSSGY